MARNGNKEERVRQRAYRIWEDEGRPSGKHQEHWRRAWDEVEEEDNLTSGDQDLKGSFMPQR